MAKNKKKPSKSVRERARRIVKSDAITSVAIVSVLLNVLFLISIIVLTNASTFDHRVYQAAKHRYCHNVDGFEARAKELGSEKAAKEELQINCVGSDFEPFYNEALQKYQAQVNQ